MTNIGSNIMTEQEFYLKIIEMAQMPTTNQQKYKDLLISFNETMLKFQEVPQELKFEAMCSCAAIAIKMNPNSITE